MSENRKEEKTAAGKLRERFYKIKESIKPSAELQEAFRKDKENYDRGKQPEKKIAKPNRPHEVDI